MTELLGETISTDLSGSPMTTFDAITRLKEGNARFVANVRGVDAILSQVRRADFVAGASPFAIILGCSDSRVPAELVFDQGLGALFVIRVAGNIVAPSQLASIEFAAQRMGTPLAVVMGHTGCGAVEATVDDLLQPHAPQEMNLSSILQRVRPAVMPLMHTELVRDRAALSRAAVRANVIASVNQVRHGTPLIENLVTNGKLTVVGAEYDLATGVVDFFEGL